MLLSYGFIIVSLLVFGVEIVLACSAHWQHSRTGRFICTVFVLCAVLNLSYLASVTIRDYTGMSIFSSVYFAVMDLLLLSLLSSVLVFMGISIKLKDRPWLYALLLFGAIDMLVLLTNPLHEAALSYIPRDTPIAFYSYDMHTLYQVHLAYSYLLVAIILLRMIYQAVKVPQGYRKQFLIPVLGMAVIVAINALFLFLPGLSIINFIDYSILLYGLGGMLFYWTFFRYARHGMLEKFKNYIFENINQGLIMFDYQENLILKNAKAEQLLSTVNWAETLSFGRFLHDCGFPEGASFGGKDYSIQCYQGSGEQLRPLRCDYRPLKNRRGQIIGRLFVFSDMTLESDLLTGFRSRESFQQALADGISPCETPLCAAVCDINNLTEINSTLGRNIGDQAISALAELLRQNFPDCSFVRGREAHLIVLCPHMTEDQVQRRMLRVKNRFPTSLPLPIPLEMQSALCCAKETAEIQEAVRAATRTLRTKKLLDHRSSHSVVLSSLIRALKESDDDTEAHVQRTQNMGALLGRRIGLTDAQQGDLSLLCILHDIGKIGIPLEILNKPGKLTDDEWNVLKTHVIKGEQIARSSADLAGIADMIRHHHERWDGNGYPDGLKGEDIPLLSRVIAVVDSYDAMVNNRSYRKALTLEKARAELRRCAGTQFDPVIAEAFLLMLEEDLPRQEPEAAADVRTAAGTELDSAENPNAFLRPVRFSRYITDDTDRIISADSAFTSFTGYTQDDISSGSLHQNDLIFPEDRTEYFQIVNDSLSRNQSVYCEHRIRRKDGSVLYVLCYGKQFYDSAARVMRSEIILTDIAATRSMQSAFSMPTIVEPARWSDRYDCDPRTGLLARESFREAVERRIRSHPSRIMLLIFRIDTQNTSPGTFGGQDAVLTLAARELAAALRRDDFPCMLDSSHLAAALFFSGTAQDELLHERAQQICDKLNMSMAISQNEVTISAGGAISGRKYSDLEDLFAAAEHALRRVDSKGALLFSTE